LTGHLGRLGRCECPIHNVPKISAIGQNGRSSTQAFVGSAPDVNGVRPSRRKKGAAEKKMTANLDGRKNPNYAVERKEERSTDHVRCVEGHIKKKSYKGPQEGRSKNVEVLICEIQRDGNRKIAYGCEEGEDLGLGSGWEVRSSMLVE